MTWSLTSVAVGFCCALLRTIVIARLIAPAEIGLMGIALLALGFMEAGASTGVDTALVVRKNAIEEYIDPAFTIQVIRGLVVFGLLWAAAPALARVFQDSGTVTVIRSVAAIAVLRGLLNPAVALALKRLDFRRIFWWSLPEMLSTLCFTVVLGFVRRDVWALVIGAIAGQAIGIIASYGLVPRMPRLVVDRGRILELLRFGRFVSGSRALMYFSVNLDSAVVGMTIGPHALGIYQFAARVAELPVVTVTKAVAQVALPTLSGGLENAAARTRTWRAMLSWVFAVNGTAAILILLFGETAIVTLVGPQWLGAVPVMRILTVAMLFRALVILAGQLLDAAGQPALTLRVNAARLGALAIALAPMAAWGGLPGVALAVLLANAGAALFALKLSSRVLRQTSDSSVVLSS